MDQLERIAHMEGILNRGREAVDGLEQALEDYAAVREELAELDAYYSGDLWRRDYDDDAAGRIPKDLKRGVLSEDAVYDLLTDRDRLRGRLEELGRD